MSKEPRYTKMLQDLPSDVEGYTINLGQTRGHFDVFVCDKNGVPVVVSTIKTKDENQAYEAAKELVKKYYGKNEK